MENKKITSRNLLLTTALAGISLLGYGRRAYAACTNVGGTTYACSGVETNTQQINADNASVSTNNGFSINTAYNNAINITGYGVLSFTDTRNSVITSASGNALNIVSYGDINGTAAD